MDKHTFDTSAFGKGDKLKIKTDDGEIVVYNVLGVDFDGYFCVDGFEPLNEDWVMKGEQEDVWIPIEDVVGYLFNKS